MTAAFAASANPAESQSWLADARRTVSVSIVMPCLDEEETVAICVQKALWYLHSRDLKGEVVVVDNGSTDDSVRLATEAGARVVHETRRGYGAALRRGFREAKGQWLVMGDCDDTYDFTLLDDLLEPLTRGYGMVVGNRFRGDMAPRAMTWSHRYVGTPVLSSLLRLFTGTDLGDSQCGLRAFTRETRDRLDLQTDGMELASEMIMKAARRSVKMCEVAIPYGERLGETKLNTVRDGWRHLRFLLLMTPNFLFTLPGILLTVVGLLTLGASLPADAIEIGSLTWQPIFAGGIFLVVGLNALMFGFASRLYASSRGFVYEDAWVRFYRKHCSLESLLALGLSLVLGGVVLDLVLAFAGTGSLSQLGVAAIAQVAIIFGANVVLVGFLTSLIDHDADVRTFASTELDQIEAVEVDAPAGSRTDKTEAA
jgi:glycosyltransferase involved in cell wall biosynthesis